MKNCERFHQAVSARIAPTFDALESFCGTNKTRNFFVNIALLASLPAWCALASLVNKCRQK